MLARMESTPGHSAYSQDYSSLTTTEPRNQLRIDHSSTIICPRVIYPFHQYKQQHVFYQSAVTDAMQPPGAWRYVGTTVGSQFHPGYYFFQEIDIPDVQQMHVPNRGSTINRTSPVSVSETGSLGSDRLDSISSSQAAHGYRPWLTQDSNSGDYEYPGKRLRDMAWEETARCSAAFTNSKWAYDLGNKLEAEQFAEQGKLHDDNREMYNSAAAAEIFASRNRRLSEKNGQSRCDLRGLFVEEAIYYASDHLVSCRNTGINKTLFIVGNGYYNQGFARLRPAILSMLKQTSNISHKTHKKDKGKIIVKLYGVARQ